MCDCSFCVSCPLDTKKGISCPLPILAKAAESDFVLIMKSFPNGKIESVNGSFFSIQDACKHLKVDEKDLFIKGVTGLLQFNSMKSSKSLPGRDILKPGVCVADISPDFDASVPPTKKICIERESENYDDIFSIPVSKWSSRGLLKYVANNKEKRFPTLLRIHDVKLSLHKQELLCTWQEKDQTIQLWVPSVICLFQADYMNILKEFKKNSKYFF